MRRRTWRRFPIEAGGYEKRGESPGERGTEYWGYHTLYHDLFTNGIGYLRLIFRLDQIPENIFRISAS